MRVRRVRSAVCCTSDSRKSQLPITCGIVCAFLLIVSASKTTAMESGDKGRFAALTKPIHYTAFHALLDWVDTANDEERLLALQEILELPRSAGGTQIQPMVGYLASRLIAEGESSLAADDSVVSSERLNGLLGIISENLSTIGLEVDSHRAIADLLQFLTTRFPGEILNWIESEQPLKNSYSTINTVLAIVAETLPDEALEHALLLPAGSQRDIAIVHILQTLSKSEPIVAGDLFTENLSVDSRLSFLDMFIDGPIRDQPQVALDVIQSLPDSIDPRTYHHTEAKVRSWVSIPDALDWAETPPWGTEQPSPYPHVLAQWAIKDFDAVLEFSKEKIISGAPEFARHLVFAMLESPGYDHDLNTRIRDWLESFNLPPALKTELQQILNFQ